MSTPDDRVTRDLGVEPGWTDDGADPPIEDDDEEMDLGPELAVGFSPRQILGGFALLAAILVWLFRRRAKRG